MQENRELTGLNEHLTDAEIALAIRYLDPDVYVGGTGEDAGTLIGICITLLTVSISAITYISLYMRNL